MSHVEAGLGIVDPDRDMAARLTRIFINAVDPVVGLGAFDDVGLDWFVASDPAAERHRNRRKLGPEVGPLALIVLFQTCLSCNARA
jgi:hypothetical protein